MNFFKKGKFIFNFNSAFVKCYLWRTYYFVSWWYDTGIFKCIIYFLWLLFYEQIWSNDRCSNIFRSLKILFLIGCFEFYFKFIDLLNIKNSWLNSYFFLTHRISHTTIRLQNRCSFHVFECSIDIKNKFFYFNS